jgi:hypothetical protein
MTTEPERSSAQNIYRAQSTDQPGALQPGALQPGSAPVQPGSAQPAPVQPAPAPAEDTSPPVQPIKRRQRILVNRFFRFIVWIIVIVVMIYVALLIAALLTGFVYDNGFPNVFEMIDWIRTNYDLTR